MVPIVEEASMKSSVLIVDDEPTIRRVLAEIVSETGLPAMEAGDASEALNALRKSGRAVGVLVTDVTMPGFLNGMDLAKLVNQSWPWIKLVVMTTFADSVQNGSLGNARVLEKPLKPKEIASTILQAAAEFDRVQATGSLH
jgi:DNA-binding NtrC family response regulator